ncbi:XdhC family protein [Tsuneonella sp. YG55]|uniref:XdhC family protein n=1 Tax=Tsuneonella litorea TaxID=2976475 RepID=A0A9X2VY60_9SPHN|nr:XdhC family protein [Tsuneonella litorea]MCT2557487.1 XdhC family protein [Tsuneonella litorea]
MYRRPPPAPSLDDFDEDQRALAAARRPGTGLCTIVGIDGAFSRRLGAQLAVLPGGEVVGSLSDGCLERQLASDCAALSEPALRRYGSGSPLVDFRLPCGSGLDILLDPEPDRAACASVVDTLLARRPAALPLPHVAGMGARPYIPRLRIAAFGEGPELAALHRLARASDLAIEAIGKDRLSLGRPSGQPGYDAWTAVILLFHDHEWELALIEEAMASEAFYIGAQGGLQARRSRIDELARRGASEAALSRVRSPIGTPAGSRSPQTLALSVLAEVAHEYERLRTRA